MMVRLNFDSRTIRTNLRRLLLLAASSSALSASAATFNVVNTDDSGPGSLRQAILGANSSPGPDDVDFGGMAVESDPGCWDADGYGNYICTITLQSGLPAITDSLIMDGSIPETRSLPGGPGRRPGIELDHSAIVPTFKGGLPFFPNGLALSGPSASGSELRGFIINGLQGLTTVACGAGFLNPDLSMPPLPDGPVPETDLCAHPLTAFGVDGAVLAGNYVNVDASGTTTKGTGSSGINLMDSNGVTVGGEQAHDRNVLTVTRSPAFGPWGHIVLTVSGWGSVLYGPAVPKSTSQNQLLGNYINVAADGSALASHSYGIVTQSLDIAPNTAAPGPVGWGQQCTEEPDGTIPCDMRGNLIRGNTIANENAASINMRDYHEDTVIEGNTVYSEGVSVFSYVHATKAGNHPGDHARAVNLTVRNNQLGVNADGIPIGLAVWAVFIQMGDGVQIENNVITGAYGGLINVNNRGDEIGPTPGINVSMSQNSLFNGDIDQLGYASIDLFEGFFVFGPTANDDLDPDVGANNLQNYPVLTSAVARSGGIKVKGHLNSEPKKKYRIEFFSSDQLNPSGLPEAKHYLGSITLKTNKNGDKSITSNRLDLLEVGDLVNVGDYITATATELCTPDIPEPGDCPFGASNTSELSVPVVLE